MLRKDIITIEQLRRRATKAVTEMKNLSYEQWLISLGLPTLLSRRERAEVLQLFKIMNDYEEVSLNSLKKTSFTSTCGQSMKLMKTCPKNNLGHNRFCNRVVNQQNSLSEDTVTASSINSFKSRLNKDWSKKEGKFGYKFNN